MNATQADPTIPKSIRIWIWWKNFRKLGTDESKYDEWDKAILMKAIGAAECVAALQHIMPALGTIPNSAFVNE